MKRRLLAPLSVLMALALLLSACGPAGDAYHMIDAEEAKAMLEKGGVTLVDVRSHTEYEEGHIPGALILPKDDIGAQPPELLPDKDATIIVYCRTAVRSKEAAKKLVNLGYTNVYDMTGGIEKWSYGTVAGPDPGTALSGERVTDPAASASGAETEPSGILSSFTATDLAGNEVDQTIFADYDLTMVNVWATFCGPCINEMPELGEVSRQYAEAGASFQIVGIVSDLLDRDGNVSEALLKNANDIVAASDAGFTHLIPSVSLYPLLGQITAVPTTLFVDKDGNQVGYAQMGSRDKAGWTKVIDEMLAEVEG